MVTPGILRERGERNDEFRPIRRERQPDAEVTPALKGRIRRARLTDGTAWIGVPIREGDAHRRIRPRIDLRPETKARVCRGIVRTAEREPEVRAAAGVNRRLPVNVNRKLVACVASIRDEERGARIGNHRSAVRIDEGIRPGAATTVDLGDRCGAVVHIVDELFVREHE